MKIFLFLIVYLIISIGLASALYVYLMSKQEWLHGNSWFDERDFLGKCAVIGIIWPLSVTLFFVMFIVNLIVELFRRK